MKGIYLLLYEFERQHGYKGQEKVSLADMVHKGESSTWLPFEGFYYNPTIWINKSLDLKERVITFFHELRHMDRGYEDEFFGLNFRESVRSNIENRDEWKKERNRVHRAFEKLLDDEAEEVCRNRSKLVEYVTTKYGLDKDLPLVA